MSEASRIRREAPAVSLLVKDFFFYLFLVDDCCRHGLNENRSHYYEDNYYEVAPNVAPDLAAS